jgi:hypothetical protein
VNERLLHPWARHVQAATDNLKQPDGTGRVVLQARNGAGLDSLLRLAVLYSARRVAVLY